MIVLKPVTPTPIDNAAAPIRVFREAGLLVLEMAKDLSTGVITLDELRAGHAGNQRAVREAGPGDGQQDVARSS
jgi:hypothetical protein